MGDNLVIITTSYPFGFGEPFLEEELKVLSLYFVKIWIVVPEAGKVDSSLQRFSLPENAEVILLNVSISRLDKFLAIFSIFKPRILRHLLYIQTAYHLTISKKILKALFAYEARERVFRHLLVRELGERKISYANLCLYTYWFTEYTYSLVQIKTRHPEVKAVTRAHGWDIYFERHDPPYLPLRGYIINHLDRVVTISENGRAYLLKKIPNVIPEKITTHRLGISAGEPKREPPNGKSVTLLSLAFIAPVKRLELLIDGLSEVEDLDIQWRHIGGGDDYAQAVMMYAKSRLGDKANINFFFHGTMTKDQVQSFLRENNIDFIINTSHSEGLPVSIIEAMAFGIPAVGPDIGGMSEIIENEKNGFLLSANPEPNEIANAIRKYSCLAAEEKIRLRENAHLTWKTKFCAETNHRKFAEELLVLGKRPFQICSRCILDSTDDPNITFDENGVCSMCHTYDKAVKKEVFHGAEAELKLKSLVKEIKQAGEGKEYDCIIGLSGGVDSTYVAWKVKELGLRPLAIHLDNGWDSELAVKNIENIVRRLGIDLHTHVIDWQEFRDLQLAYFKAGVIDLEIPTDHAIMAELYHQAKKNGVKYILSGHNLATEGFLPESWIHHKFDVLNLKAIHRRFGSIRLKTYPILPYQQRFYYEKIAEIRVISLLNFLGYDKNEAKKLMKEKLNWRDYGGKHYESIFTRFYQAYILPRKFNVDKRKSHYSTLICSGQMTIEQALAAMKEEPYPSREMMESDRTYVLKKLGFTDREFDDYMRSPVKKHNDYPSYMNFYLTLRPLIRLYRKIFPRK